MIRNQSGNVLFYILIGVALLGALSYAVSRTNRGNAGSIGKEQTKMAATEIIEYGDILGKAVMQLRLRGVSDTQISFENTVMSGYENADCSDGYCKVFALDGGGINYVKPKEEWLDSSFSANSIYGYGNFFGRSCTEDVSCYSDGIDNEDLIYFVPFLKKDICLKINDVLGIENPSGDAPIDSGCSGAGISYKFTGTYSEDLALQNTSSTMNRKAGCFKHDTGCTGHINTYNFYKVLIER